MKLIITWLFFLMFLFLIVAAIWRFIKLIHSLICEDTEDDTDCLYDEEDFKEYEALKKGDDND